MQPKLHPHARPSCPLLNHKTSLINAVYELVVKQFPPPTGLQRNSNQMLVSQATLDETAGPYLGAVIWCDTLLDLENDFCRLFSGLRLEVVALRFRGFVHDDLIPSKYGSTGTEE